MKHLQLAWVWAMNDGGANEPTPIVHDGIIYLTNTSNTLQALDGRTGDLIWENRIGPESTRAYGATRTLGDLRRQAVPDHHGRPPLRARCPHRQDRLADRHRRRQARLQQHLRSDRHQRQGADGHDGLRPVRRGLLHQRLRRRAPASCSGSFSTIAREGPARRRHLGQLPDLLRAGGDTWIAGSYDPDLNLTYWGVAQPKPWMRVSRGAKPGDKALFTSSTLALDPDTGKLKWYFQHAPGESFDMDEVFERVLVDLDGRKLLFTIGKPGILWKLDRETGQFLGYKETVFQNLFASIDPKTGEPTYRSDILEQQIGQWFQICPSTEGGHNWQAMSYHPATAQLIIPLSQSCMIDVGPQGGIQGEFGRRRGRPAAFSRCRARTATSASWRPTTCDTLKENWSIEQRAPFLTAVLSTGRRRRVCRRSRSLFPRGRRQDRQGALEDAPRAPRCRAIRSAFAIGGKQYIAVTTGLGGGSPRDVPRVIAPEIHHPGNGNALYVFALPDDQGLRRPE